ncbi:PAS domain-containing protein [Sphingomonas sp. CGMCC 1.13654]|uniref:histidine kinase n=1 Tax=Sphingomonas chungangi TaxID=2683589 RepID=A0A838L6R2_9SPHN|nr:hybrid sensor histidine kinase/response regulator [Sphingomonas chungangi]MBA2935173.1 PAS domain-containing protein [Sphingomonas chungangi]MVW55251.1 PAS domain-containing protein [Sphingomonas chungangi]
MAEDGGLSHAALVTAGASGSWDWDIAADELRIDAAFAELYGLERGKVGAALSTATFFSRIHRDDRARMKIAVAGMLGGAERFSKEFRIQAADGSFRWMHGRGQSHFSAQDEPVRFTGLLVDVTERKRAEERLRVAQSAGGVGTFEYVDGFATASVSDEFCRLLGLHPASVLPIRTVNGLVRPGSAPIIPDSIDPATTQLLGEFEVVRSSDGALRWVARRGEVVRNDGPGYRFIGVIYDVTASKQAEARLRDLNDSLERRVKEEIAVRLRAEEALLQSQKMEAIGQLASGIAHDFNNLLTIITGNVETVGRRLDEQADPRIRRAIDNAMKGAERAAALTHRLLAFSRRQALIAKPTDMAVLLTGMSDLVTRSISETIAIHIHVQPGLWWCEIDQHQLENAVLNLAVNARDAMPDGGSLSIEARNLSLDAQEPNGRSGDFVVITVVDTGTGMSPETISKVFDPFFTTKEVGKGTGLGLSMVYGFVTQSGGHVDIQSTLGKGTRIALHFPRLLSNEEPVLAAPATNSDMGHGAETILVVEDDDDVRAHTVDLLRELGYRVLEAHDGDTALRLLARPDQDVQLLLTDVVMPAMSGWELAKAARSEQPQLKVLFTSGYPRDAILKNGQLEPGIDLLPKPFSFAALSERIRSQLDR